MADNIHSGHRQRMRNKVINHSSGLLDHELLEILLYYCQPRKNTNEQAHQLIKEFGSIKNIFNARAQELEKVKGISESTIAFLKLFPKLFDKYNTILHLPLTNVRTLFQLKHFIAPVVKNAYNETLYIVYIDEKFDAYAYESLKKGDAMRIDLAMDEILASVQRKAPKYVALAHNHPLGSCIPSTADIVSTIKIKYMLKFLNIELYEHIIFGTDGYTSIKDIVDGEINAMLKNIDQAQSKVRRNAQITIYKDD